MDSTGLTTLMDAHLAGRAQRLDVRACAARHPRSSACSTLAGVHGVLDDG